MNGICKLFGHRWDGCRCSRCGLTRNEGHAWVESAEQCEHTCAVCGVTETVPCTWFHCRCNRCGALRDEHHLWLAKTPCEQVCRVCGKERETHDWRHVDRGVDKCAVCGTLHRLTAEEIARRDEEWASTDDFPERFEDEPDFSADQD